MREEEEKEGNLVKAPSPPVVAKIPKEGGGGAFVLGGSVPLMMLPCGVWAPLERRDQVWVMEWRNWAIESVR